MWELKTGNQVQRSVNKQRAQTVGRALETGQEENSLQVWTTVAELEQREGKKHGATWSRRGITLNWNYL